MLDIKHGQTAASTLFNLDTRCNLNLLARPRQIAKELPRPAGVHAWAFDQNEVRRTEEINARSQEEELNKITQRQAGLRDEAASESESSGDDQHVHQVEGVAHASGE